MTVGPSSIFFNRIPQAKSAAEAAKAPADFSSASIRKRPRIKLETRRSLEYPLLGTPRKSRYEAFGGHRHLRRNRDRGVEFTEVQFIRRSVLEGSMREHVV